MAKGEIVEPREIVKADNAFFRVRCKVKNIIATRIVMAFASLVDESDLNEHERFLEYRIDASSILDGIDAGGNYYNQLREAAYTLIDQKLEQRKHKNHFKVYALFSTIEYENGIITGKFHSDLLPFFLNASYPSIIIQNRESGYQKIKGRKWQRGSYHGTIYKYD